VYPAAIRFGHVTCAVRERIAAVFVQIADASWLDLQRRQSPTARPARDDLAGTAVALSPASIDLSVGGHPAAACVSRARGDRPKVWAPSIAWQSGGRRMSATLVGPEGLERRHGPTAPLEPVPRDRTRASGGRFVSWDVPRPRQVRRRPRPPQSKPRRISCDE